MFYHSLSRYFDESTSFLRTTTSNDLISQSAAVNSQAIFAAWYRAKDRCRLKSFDDKLQMISSCLRMRSHIVRKIQNRLIITDEKQMSFCKSVVRNMTAYD
ncbi:hypothetical protein V1477_001810 [Vespula maculifrons]|uniref:Uncharacterized protein n=1 Tax=Vespula maculifrons TaxID=7453 RepID=A0ABD2CX66_VESMC